MRKNIAKLMMIVGLVLLAVPTLGELHTKYEQQKLYKTYLEELSQLEESMQVLNDTLDNGLNELSEADERGDIEGATKDMATDNSPSLSTIPNGIEVIGLITIPKIDVTLMFVEGVSKQDLKYAVGHMPGTGMPGEVGNCAIAGHRSYTFGEYFNRLDELEIGDEIHITAGKKQYTYKVYESFLVEPTEVSVTEPERDKKIVTLITCHPVVKATHRLIVKGELVEE